MLPLLRPPASLIIDANGQSIKGWRKGRKMDRAVLRTLDEISKAIDRSKLVRKPVMVSGKSGKVYQAYRWVKQDEKPKPSREAQNNDSADIFKDALGNPEYEGGISVYGASYGRPGSGGRLVFRAASDAPEKQWPYESKDVDHIVKEMGLEGWDCKVEQDGYGAPSIQCEHRKTKAYAQTLKEKHDGKWKDAKEVFVRYGDIPESGYSTDWSSGNKEKGVSVFRGKLLPDGSVLPIPKTNQELGSLLTMNERPVYVVDGDVVGVGADGEPVLVNAKQYNPKKYAKKIFSGDVRKSLTWSGFPLQGRCKVHGLDISIENRKGSVRRGVDKDGHEWKTKMHYAYGYIRGTVGKDKDHLDCYIGPDKKSCKVFIVHQNDPVTGDYDEDKVMIGWNSAEEAKAAYLKQYDRPGFFGSMHTTDIDTFKKVVLDKKNHGKKLVIRKSMPEKLDNRFYEVFKHIFSGEDGKVDVYRNKYKLKDLEGFPSGVDLENCDIIRYGENTVTIEAGGDWQQGIMFEVGLKNGKLAVVSKFYSQTPQTKTERKKVAKLLSIKKSRYDDRLNRLIERKYTPELEIGIKVEMEHTDDPEEAKKIALDHLSENFHYYTELVEAGLVDEPEALAAAEGFVRLKKSIRLVIPVLEKARKNPKLIPVKRAVTRDGKVFMMTVWVLPADAKKMQSGSAVQFDLFDQPPASGGYQFDLFDQPQEAAPEAPEVKAAKEELQAVKEIVKTTDSAEKKDSAVARAINLASPETRNAVADAVTADFPEMAEDVKEEPYEFTPRKKTISIGAAYGEIEVDDYTGVIPKKIGVFSPAKALEMERPSWLPDVNVEFFRNEQGRLPFFKLDENQYAVQVDRQRFVLASVDVLAAVNDFYAKREKETVKRKIKDDLDEKTAAAKKWMTESSNVDNDNSFTRSERYFHERVLEGKYKSRIKPFRVIGDNKMTWTQMGLIQGITGNKSQRDAWAVFHGQMSELKQKSSDMEIQLEDMRSTFAKGRETAYGESGVKRDLLDSHGVKVKRQNGDKITPQEIEQIKSALDSVFSAFGDRSSMARKYGLKISHSGDKLMHARRALGIYFPYYKAIGVTAQLGDAHMGFILSHEWAHFMDNYLGGKTYHYASDEQGSSAHAIAKTFRGSMMKAQTSDYQNRTCECFARAFEEYYSIKSGDSAALQEYRSGQGNYVDPEKFKTQIAPMIEEFLKEKSEMLKSMNVWMFKQ